jgi:hypothetical protein
MDQSLHGSKSPCAICVWNVCRSMYCGLAAVRGCPAAASHRIQVLSSVWEQHFSTAAWSSYIMDAALEQTLKAEIHAGSAMHSCVHM